MEKIQFGWDISLRAPMRRGAPMVNRLSSNLENVGLMGDGSMEMSYDDEELPIQIIEGKKR